jgi:hypothetical protein
VEITLIKVADARLGGTERVKTAEGLVAIYSSRARTLVDAVYDWSRFNSLPRAYDWIRQDLGSGRTSAADLVRAAVKYGNQGALRRIGFLLEQEGASRLLLTALQRALRSPVSAVPWNPTGPNRGTITRPWGVILTEPR